MPSQRQIIDGDFPLIVQVGTHDEAKKRGRESLFAHVDCAFKILAQQVVKDMSRTMPARSLSRLIVERRLQPLDLAPRESIEPGA